MVTRLRWNGNNIAQSQADAAFNRWRSKAEKRKKAKAAAKAAKKKKRGKKPRQAAFKRPKYHEYITSAAWFARREQLFERRGKKCERCGSLNDIQVHHLNYKRVGRERDSDLEVLCRGCHQNEHEGKVPGIVDPMTAEYLVMFRGY